jgi:amino acid transporter
MRKTYELYVALIGVVAVTLIYLLVNVAYMHLLTPIEIAESKRVAADAVSRALGPVGGSLISVAIFISTFGVVGVYTLTAPRIYFAMAKDGLFFRSVANIHPRFQTPAVAIADVDVKRIGLDPVTDYLEGVVPLDEQRQVIVNGRMETTSPSNSM